MQLLKLVIDLDAIASSIRSDFLGLFVVEV
jgi:hypothetical protein